MTTTVGYASSADWGVHFGLGDTAVMDRIEISWPSGVKQILREVKADQVLNVREE
jgi:hypothetical protein